MIKELYETFRRFNEASLKLVVPGDETGEGFIAVRDAADTGPLDLPAVIFEADSVTPYESQPAMPRADTFEAELSWSILIPTDDFSREQALALADDLLKRTAATAAELEEFSRPEDDPDAPPALRFYTAAEFTGARFSVQPEASTRVTLFTVERRIIFQLKTER